MKRHLITLCQCRSLDRAPANPVGAQVSVDDVSVRTGPGAPPGNAGSIRPAGPPSDSNASWRAVGRSAVARAGILPITAVLGILITREVIGNFGADAFAQYGLLIGIGSLLPFADLGTSAAVVNSLAASPDPATDSKVGSVLVGVLRVVLVMAAILLAVATVLTVTGAWGSVLGAALGPHGPLAAGLCLALIAVALPAGLGQRALVGLGRNHVPILLQGLQSPVVLVVLMILVAGDVAAGPYIAVIAYGTTFVLAVMCLLLAARLIRPALGNAIRNVPRVRSVRGGRVFNVAWPMLVQMIALPLAMQTDRIVISHVCPVADLATYNLASQMYTPVWQVAAAAGTAFWPVFARARARNETPPLSPITAGWAFGGGAFVLCAGITIFSGWLSGVASGGTITLDLGIVLSFSVLMVLQATKYPSGMFMTDAAGLRYQAYLILLMLPVNLGLSWWLAVVWGPAGPVVGSAVSVLFFQVLPNMVYVRRHLTGGASA